MRLVLSGAGGFLGSHLADRLLADGHEVVGLDNFSTGLPENLAHLADNRSFTLVNCDVSREVDVAGRVDGVLHFASPASPPDYQRLAIETLDVGAFGTRRLLELAEAKGARFLLASTSEVYGDPQVHPQPESYWGNVSSTGPRSMYDEAKRFAEAMTMAWHRSRGVDTRIVRIFNTYGPRMRPSDGRVVSNFISQALGGESLTVYGDGSQTRSFCYVSDEVEGIIRLFNSNRIEPTNIGNPGEFTMLELARTVLEVTGSSSEIVFEPLPEHDPKVRCPDIAEARRHLGWQPVITLREGIERSVPWYREALL